MKKEEKNKKEKNMIEMREYIVYRLYKAGIMWFILDEVDDSLIYLNKYKLKNIFDNVDEFVKHMKIVNQNYIDSLSK